MNLIVELIQAFAPGQDGFVFLWVLAGIAVAAAILMVERWLDIRRRTNVDGEMLSDKLRTLIREGRVQEAYNICASGGKRLLPRILGAGIHKAMETPALIRSAMEEESLHSLPRLEKRLDLILMLGNVSTLLGLMGTIFGLILSFAAVAQPDVEAIEKSSMLASGISAAMNTTLLGLIISVPCVMIYSVLRSRVEQAVQEIDRYSLSVLKVLLPREGLQKDYRVSGKRIKEEIDTEPNIAPMMNLMVILIPLLLSSAEFVKIGAIELKLPESAQGGSGASSAEQKQDAKLDLGVVITAEGFDLFHFFKDDSAQTSQPDTKPQIPLREGEYDFEKLNAALADVKRRALLEIIRVSHPSIPPDAALIKLFTAYIRRDFSAIELFSDHEDIKIVAQDTIKYQTVVSVMDAARGRATPQGKVTLFPNVSLAGGIIQ
jgi:biopolymer transport protein ExbB/TolQ/biopolymer transport protein ExbD